MHCFSCEYLVFPVFAISRFTNKNMHIYHLCNYHYYYSQKYWWELSWVVWSHIAFGRLLVEFGGLITASQIMVDFNLVS